jgi:hypothetical protein
MKQVAQYRLDGWQILSEFEDVLLRVSVLRAEGRRGAICVEAREHTYGPWRLLGGALDPTGAQNAARRAMKAAA